MNNIKFEIADPHAENGEFMISIERTDSNAEESDIKLIMIDRMFCSLELPKLGVLNSKSVMNKDNLEAKEWLRLYAIKMLDRYMNDWNQQPKETRLMCGRAYPSLEELRGIK